jgi:hypothetical protein
MAGYSAELTLHMSWYVGDVARTAVCWPSHLVFMSIFSPSRYESKLWDLRHFVEQNRVLETKPPHLKTELEAFRRRYDVTSRRFDYFLSEMLDPRSDGTTRVDASNKYWYYVQSSIDWELIRVQPMRYVWNTSDTLTLYALTLTGVATLSSTTQQKTAAHLLQKMQGTHTGELVNRIVQRLTRVRVVSQISGSIRGARYPWLVANLINLGYLAGGYKPAQYAPAATP